MARTSSSDCSNPSFATVGCAPGVSKRLPLPNASYAARATRRELYGPRGPGSTRPAAPPPRPPLMLQGLQDANYMDRAAQGQTARRAYRATPHQADIRNATVFV